MIATRQPQGVARLRPEFAAGIVDVAVQRNSLLNGSAWSTFGTEPTYDVGALGRRVNALSNFGGLYLKPEINCAVAEQTHLFCGEITANTGDYAGILACASGDGSAGSFSIQRRSGASGWDVFTTGSVLSLPNGDLLTNAGVFNLVLVARAGTIRVYLNGALWGSASASPTVQSNSRIVVFGERAISSSYSTKGVSYVRGSWARGFDATTALALSANPWSLFQSSRRIYVQLGAAANESGPGTYAGTTTEAGSAADTLSALATFAGSAAETASASDTPTAVSTRSGSVAESASAADTEDASVTSVGAGTVAETGSASDTASAIQATARSTAESASAADTEDASITAAGVNATAETASAADTVSCVVVTAGSIAEGTASAADTAAAAGIWARAVAETASAIESVDGSTSVAGTGTVDDALSAVDVCDAVYVVDAPPGQRQYDLRKSASGRPHQSFASRPRAH